MTQRDNLPPGAPTTLVQGEVREVPPKASFDSIYDERFVAPSASATGGVRGRPNPSERVYAKTAEVVSTDEAVRRMNLRIQGALPPLDGAMPVPAANPGALAEIRRTAAALADTRHTEEYDPLSPSYPADAVQPGPHGQVQPVMHTCSRCESTTAYLDRSEPVLVRLPNVQVTLYATSVEITEMTITVFIRVNPRESVFVAAPGTELELVYGGTKYKCFYPGFAATVPCLPLRIMGFMRAE